MIEEIWKDVVTGDGIYKDRYQVSNLGRVRSKDVKYYSEKGNKWIVRTGKIRALSKGKNYLKLSLKVNGNERTVNVHVLVSDAFNRLRKEGEEIDHIDNDKLNNKAENLRVITRKQNTLRSVRGKVKLQGVWYRKANKNRPYCAHIMINGHRKELGAYASAEEAHQVYKEALEKHYPNGLKFT